MTEPTPAPEAADPPAAAAADPSGARAASLPQAVAVEKSRWAPSLVWLIPLIAALIGGWLAVKAVMERGPTVSIRFATAEGLEPGKTKIRFKSVDIGVVKAISLGPDRKHVVVSASLSRDAESLLVADTRFWVVRPRVAASGVSGLGTLISGSYIGVDAGRSTQREREFVGLEVPPVIATDIPGRDFTLRGEDLGSLDIGSPVFFRRVQVGQVTGFTLDKDGRGVTLSIFVSAPYDDYVSTSTRFWHASGFDVALDAAGLRVQTESLVSILVGGIAFQTPAEDADAPLAPAQAGFLLHASRSEAMKRIDTRVARFRMTFAESVRGLAPGAPVDFRGFPIGEVSDIGMQFDPRRKDIGMVVEVRLYPERFRKKERGAMPGIARQDPKAWMEHLVGNGLRGQLRSGNVLTGQLYVAIDFFPEAPKAKVDWASDPPGLPTMPGSLTELQTSAAQIVKKLEKVPFDQIGQDLRTALARLDTTLASTDTLVRRLDAEVAPEARAALADARQTLGAARQTLAAEAPLQADVRAALREVARAAEALRVLAETLERRPESLLRGKQEQEQ
jgi:paraquat-inducible protein B